jgi:hypothetical protein
MPISSIHTSPWLVGPTAVVVVGALIRTLSIRGISGVGGLAQVFIPVLLYAITLLMLEKHEARHPASPAIWPGPTGRRRLFVALLVVTDCYLALILLLGARFMNAVGI